MTEIPKLPPCPTDSREWHLAPGAPALNDAGQVVDSVIPIGAVLPEGCILYCRKRKAFVAASGIVCAMCGQPQPTAAMPGASIRKDLRGGKPCIPCEKKAAQLAALKANLAITNVRPR